MVELLSDIQKKQLRERIKRDEWDNKRKIESMPEIKDGSRIVKENERRHYIPVSDITTIRPIQDRIIVKCLDTGIDNQSKLIYIPDELRKDVLMCKVVKLPRSVSCEQLPVFVDLVVGDCVLITKRFNGFKIKDVDSKEEYLSVHIGTCMMIIKGEKDIEGYYR